MVFLGCDPYQVKEWWCELVLKPSTSGNLENIKSILNSILWRSSKKSVEDQVSKNNSYD